MIFCVWSLYLTPLVMCVVFVIFDCMIYVFFSHVTVKMFLLYSLIIIHLSSASQPPKLIHKIHYDGQRASRARYYGGDALYVTTRRGGLHVFDVSTTPPIESFTFNESTTCLEGQDKDTTGQYLALTDPCKGDVYVLDTYTRRVRSRTTLWPSSGALHVRWIGGFDFIISNPGHLWMSHNNTWSDSQSYQLDGIVLLRFDDSTDSIRPKIKTEILKH